MGVGRFYGDLMLEPLRLRPWEIAELTDEQILMAVAASRRRMREERYGQSYDPEGRPEDEQFAMHVALGRTLGLSEIDIVAQWNATHPGNERSPAGTGLLPVSSLNASNATLGEGNGERSEPNRKSVFARKGV